MAAEDNEVRYNPAHVNAYLSVADVIEALHGKLSERDMALIGYSKKTKRAIIRVIELDPALEQAILIIADLCYRDGVDWAEGIIRPSHTDHPDTPPTGGTR